MIMIVNELLIIKMKVVLKKQIINMVNIIKLIFVQKKEYSILLFIQQMTSIDLLKEIDFSNEPDYNEYKEFLKEAAKKVAKEQSVAIKKIKVPVTDEYLQNHLIVTGIPVVTKDKQDKIIKAFHTLFEKKKIKPPTSIQVGYDSEQKGNQTLYMIFETQRDAKIALGKLDKLKFTAKDTLSCFTVKQIQEVLNMDSEFTEPTITQSVYQIQNNMSESALDQFIFREVKKSTATQGDVLSLKTFNNLENNINDQSSCTIELRKHAKSIKFSPSGRYLYSCQDQGFRLYAGSRLKEKAFFHQAGGTLQVTFSPNELYAVSKSKQSIIVWAVEQEIQLTSFRVQGQLELESFQFSPNSKRLCVILENQFMIYNVENVEIFKKQLKLSQDQLVTNGKLFEAPFVQKAAWLTDNQSLFIACYEANFEALSRVMTKIYILNVNTKEEIRWKALGYHIKKVQLVVNPKGQWVAISFSKFIKKDNFSTVIQVGNLQKKTPNIEVANKQIAEKVGNISWDPLRGRFAVTYKDSKADAYTIGFFAVVDQNRDKQIQTIGTIPKTFCNKVFLSQNGVLFAIYNIDQQTGHRGKFGFGCFNLQKGKQKQAQNLPTVQLLKSDLIFSGLSYFQIEKSGRFALLGNDKVYQIWSMIGGHLYKDTFDNITDIHWRPRLKSYLSEKQQAKIADKWKQIKAKYEDEDNKRADIIKYKRQQQRLQKQKIFKEYLQKKRAYLEAFNQQRQKILGFNEKEAKKAKYEVRQRVDEVAPKK